MINLDIIDPNGVSYSKNITNYNSSLLNFGGGNFDISYGDNEDLGYGSYTFISDSDFYAWVELWGADGGAFGVQKITSMSGIGGYTKALIKFKKDINYTITAGQAGYFKKGNTHGGGGSGYMMGGQGGGLSGLFINTNYYGKNSWTNDNCPVLRENALLIAGGGGGKGNGQSSVKTDGGNGGGWTSIAGYTSSISSQDIELNSMIGESGKDSGNNGGGGGGWVGGKTGNIKDINIGASGGSGHIVYSDEYGEQPNSNLYDNVIVGITKFGDSKRQDVYRKALDESKFTVITGSRDAIKNIYKNIYMPQHGKFIVTLSDGSYDKNAYLSNINPNGIIN